MTRLVRTGESWSRKILDDGVIEPEKQKQQSSTIKHKTPTSVFIAGSPTAVFVTEPKEQPKKTARMQVFVKYMSGRVLTLDTHALDTIESLKVQIHDKMAFRPTNSA